MPTEAIGVLLWTRSPHGVDGQSLLQHIFFVQTEHKYQGKMTVLIVQLRQRPVISYVAS